MPATYDRQFCIDPGLTTEFLMGEGTDYPFIDLDGLDQPTVRITDANRPLNHGDSAGLDLLDSRVLTITVGISDYYRSATYQPKLDKIKGAWQPRTKDSVLQFIYNDLNNHARRVTGRPRKIGWKSGNEQQFGIPTIVMTFLCTDPVIYDDFVAVYNVALLGSGPNPAFGFNFGFPFAFGTAQSANTVTVGNAGTFKTTPTVDFFGPLTAPAITNLTQGKTWRSTISLGAGDQLQVNFHDHTVLLNPPPGGNQYGTMPSDSQWWDFDPGNSNVQLSAAGGTGYATISVRNAWL